MTAPVRALLWTAGLTVEVALCLGTISRCRLVGHHYEERVTSVGVLRVCACGRRLP